MLKLVLALRAPALPPSLAGFLFENHWLWWITLLVVGCAVLLMGRLRADRRILRGGLVVLGLTAAWALAAWALDTPAERLHAVHVGLAKAAEQHDVDAILGYCQPRFSIASININPNTADAKAEIKSRIDQLNIKDTTFTRYEITLNADGTAMTRFVALTKSDMGALLTTWEVNWDDVPGQDWRIHSADLLKLGDQTINRGEIVK